MNFKFFNRIVSITPPLLLEGAWYRGALHLHIGINTRFIQVEPAKPTP